MVSFRKKVLAIFLSVAGLHLVLILGISMSGGCSSPKVLKNRPYVPDPAPSPLPPAGQSGINLKDEEVIIDNKMPPVIEPAPTKNLFPPLKPVSSQNLQHTVSRGESFWTIARKYGVGMKELAAFNKLPVDKPLKTGQVLAIPPGGMAPAEGVSSSKSAEKETVSSTRKSSSKSVTSAKTTVSSGTGEYVVQKGDSLWKIAVRHNLKTETLASANHLDPRAPLKLGQKLVIPGGSGKATAKATAPKAATASESKTKKSSEPKAIVSSEKPVETLVEEAIVEETTENKPSDVELLKENTEKETADDIIGDLTAPKSDDKALKDEVNQLLQDTGTGEAPAPDAAGVEAPPTAASPAPAAPKAAHGEHEVTKGETVEIIAKQYGFAVQQVLDLNPGLTANGPLKEGLKVNIP